jgi:Cytochrome oxidase complex assembly protein 1
MWRVMLPKARHIVALAVFTSLLLTLLYVIERNSDPYDAAERFLSSDVRVTALVGPAIRIDFKFWQGFDVVSSSNGGKASYTFEVTGSKGTAIVEVHLRSSAGAWQVVTADVRSSDGAVSRIVGAAFVLSAGALC